MTTEWKITTFSMSFGGYRSLEDCGASRGSRLTMLVAWHKFDNYERSVLVTVTGVELHKLPFVKIPDVLRILTDTEYKMKKQRTYWFSAIDFRKRIIRAVKDHLRKRKRHRERIIP